MGRGLLLPLSSRPLHFLREKKVRFPVCCYCSRRAPTTAAAAAWSPRRPPLLRWRISLQLLGPFVPSSLTEITPAARGYSAARSPLCDDGGLLSNLVIKVMATNESVDTVQENNADTQTVVDEDEFVIEEVGTDSDDQAADKGAGLIEPRKDMIFHSENDAVAFYRRYAQKKGFTITRRSSKIEDEKVRYFTLACSRQGKAQYNPKNKWKPKTSSRVQCPAKINFCIHDPDNKFRVTSLTLEHNHDLCPTEKKIIVSQKKPDQGAKRNRRASNGRSEVHANKKLSSTPVQTRSLVLLGDYGNHQFGDNEYVNNSKEERRHKLGPGDVHVLYRYFFHMQSKNPNFSYVMDFDEDSQLRNVFWADARSRAAYEYFSDVVRFDSTLLKNSYELPFVLFIGINHHGESVILGCGLLANDATDTFVWLFKSWLACMSDKPPKGIITDQCQTMQDAAEKVFPETCHRWCSWNIMKKVSKRICALSEFENIKINLSNVVYESLTKSDFEKGWNEMISRFGLQNNEFFTGLYLNRQKWVPAYMKDTFWAGMCSTQECECDNASIDVYVKSGITLNQFLEHYNNVLRDMVEKENDADLKSCQEMTPCITHYDIEKQFQLVYTNKKFEEFQEQVKGKIYCYPTLLRLESSVYIFKVVQDVKIGEQQLSVDFTVWFKGDGCDVRCTCQNFEFRGMLCSHVISVLALMKIKEVPSKYVLQRWRKGLNRSHTSITCSFDDMIDSPVAQRFDDLCKSFYVVAEKAATSDELFNLVVEGLRELKVKVDAQLAAHDNQNQKDNPVEHQDVEMQ